MRAPPRKRKAPPDVALAVEPTPRKIAPFLVKLIKLLDECPADAGFWSDDGKSFWVHDDRACQSVIPAHFAHASFRSFARQLSCYGFRKARRRDANGWSEFAHPLFRRGEPHLLAGIKRMDHLSPTFDVPKHPERNDGLEVLGVAALAAETPFLAPRDLISDDPPRAPFRTLGGDNACEPPAKENAIPARSQDRRDAELGALRRRVDSLEAIVASLLQRTSA